MSRPIVLRAISSFQMLHPDVRLILISVNEPAQVADEGIDATAPTVLTVHPSVPASTVAELIAAIKATPGRYSYASPGTGTPPHLQGELFCLSQQLDMVHVPFSSGGLAIGSTVAGHTPISFGALPPAVQHVKEGQVRALAITSATRSDALPDVGTTAQAGYPDVAADIWTAVLVPAGTPKDIVALLQGEIAKLVATPDVKQRFSKMGYDPVGDTSDQCAKFIASEATRWAKVIRDAGIKMR